MKKFLIAAAMFVASINTFAADVVEDTAAWFMVKGKYHFTKDGPWWGALELDPRFNHGISDAAQLQFKPEIGYDFTKDLSFGVAYIANMTGDDLAGREDRLHETVYWNFKLSSLNISTRHRLEQRWLDGFEGAGDVNWRIREQIRAELPVAETKFFLAASEELFINLDNNNPNKGSGFAENRAYGGVGYYFTPHVKLDTGYQVRYLVLDNQANHHDNIWMTNVNFNF